MTLVNGGWLVVDQCVRASHEGQMFAEQQVLAMQQQERNSAWPVTKSSTALIDKAGTNPITEERIAHRLEFLAMGEKPDDNSSDSNSKLEVDVRAALRASSFPPTSEGTREALVQME